MSLFPIRTLRSRVADVFAQIIRGKVSDPSAVRPVVDRLMTHLGATATGWLGSTSGITAVNEVLCWCGSSRRSQLRPTAIGPPDSTDVTVEQSGHPDAAGVVQVMMGQTNGPARAK